MQDTQDADLAPYLRPGKFVNSDHPDVIAFARAATLKATTDGEKAVALYFAVRDGVRYDPYVAIADPAIYYADHCLAKGSGFCVSKAVLLAAAARVVGLPSRVAFADVHNHLSTPRLREALGTDVFTHHGFTELWLDGRWVKVTPTFNIELCERFGVMTLDFDGENDALLHPYDAEGRRHMEYVADQGAHADVPIDQLLKAMHDTYGADVNDRLTDAGDFAREASGISGA